MDRLRRIWKTVDDVIDDLTTTPPPRTATGDPWDILDAPTRASGSLRGRLVEPAPARWIAPGDGVSIAGFDLPDGMLYLGTDGPEAIDPALPIDPGKADIRGERVPYYPSYAQIPASSRTAYLLWLSGGRRNAEANIGYVYLFWYGLERRVVTGTPGPAELQAIRDEVAGLLHAYEHNGTFAARARGFLDLIDMHRLIADPAIALPAPPLSEDRLQAPLSLRAEIGRLAERGENVPWDRALAWAWYLPDNPVRTPVTRCRNEFIGLFGHRFRERYPEGLAVRAAKGRVAVQYDPVRHALPDVLLKHPTLPDSFKLAGPAGHLKKLFADVTTELEPYSRLLGRNPDARNGLAASALLPAPLLATRNSGVVARARAWIASSLGSRGMATATGADLLHLWSPTATTITKANAIQLMQVMGHLGVGIEPDPRFGGPTVTADAPIVLFRTDQNAPLAATREYTAAVNLVHLATAVTKAHGTIDDTEIDRLGDHLQASLHLTKDEATRLHAHFRWLATTDISLNGLKRRFAETSPAERESIGDLLVTLAAADGTISPGEVAMLKGIAKLLDLDPAFVDRKVRASAATVAIPVAPKSSTPGSTTPAPYVVSLDDDAIARKLAETADVSALLGAIFRDVEEPVEATTTPPPVIVTDPVADLDVAHSALVRCLVVRDEWTRAEIDALCADLSLMPGGAIDRINETSLEATEEPLLEGDDPVTVNAWARAELLG